MAVKSYYASGAYNPATVPQNPLPAAETQGHVKNLCSTQEVANGDSIASVINFGRVPSNARIVANARLDNDALAGLTDFSLGIGKTTGGVFTLQAVACLIANATLAAAGSRAFTAVDIANLNKPLWQIAGYADDPGGDLEIVGTLNTAAGAAGTITLTGLFSTP